MLAKKGGAGKKAETAAAALVVEPIVGERQRAFRLAAITDEQREHFLKANAPEHSKQFNHE